MGFHLANKISRQLIIEAIENNCGTPAAANILNISVFNALSIGSGLVAAVFLCMNRDIIFRALLNTRLISSNFNFSSLVPISV